MKPLLVALLALACTGLCACTRVRAQLVVVVDSNMMPPADFDQLRVVVREAGNPEAIYKDQTFSWGRARGQFILPASFGVAPLGGDTRRRVRIEITPRSSTNRIVFAQPYRVVTGFVSDHVLRVDVFLDRQCQVATAPVCPEDQTCGREGACVPVEVPPEQLPPYVGFDGGTSDTRGIAPDGALGDGRTDAGRDAGPLDAMAAAAPRLVAPISTARLSGGRPTLRWLRAGGAGRVQVELARDRAMATGTTAPLVVDADSVTVPTLATGTWFWRVNSLTADGRVATRGSTVWQFTVGYHPSQTVLTGVVPDVNGDGLADLLIGADQAASGRGAVYVYRGTSTGISNTVDPASPPTPTTTSNFGYAVAAAGDVNGDGFGDALVGAFAEAANAGAAYLFFGGANGLGAVPLHLTAPTGTNTFGYSVAAAGDLDQDGYGDVIIGAPGSTTTTGPSVRLYRGGASGLTPWRTLSGAMNSKYGTSVAGACDLNGDGIADALLGSPGTSSITGAAYFVPGSIGASTAGAQPLAAPTGLTASWLFGNAVACAGDTNGDGRADVIVGAPGSTASAAAHVVLYVDGTPRELIVTEAVGTQRGYSVAGGGDFDRDGFGDVVVGAPASNLARGAVYVHLAAGGAFSAAPRTITSTVTNASLGWSVGATSDLNADGIDDALVGATGANQVVLVFGGPAGTVTSATRTLNAPTAGDFGVSVAARVRARTDGPG